MPKINLKPQSAFEVPIGVKKAELEKTHMKSARVCAHARAEYVKNMKHVFFRLE